MSCINVKATLLNLPVAVGVSLLGGITCSAWVMNCPLNIKAKDVSLRLKVSGHLVCTANKSDFIRFKDSLLSWYGVDNKEGVIKYNVLAASGKWSLEEVEIEELL